MYCQTVTMVHDNTHNMNINDHSHNLIVWVCLNYVGVWSNDQKILSSILVYKHAVMT